MSRISNSDTPKPIWPHLMTKALAAQVDEDYAEARRLSNLAFEDLVAETGLRDASHVARLLNNASWAANRRDRYRCPRCAVTDILWTHGHDWPVGVATS